MTNTKASQPDVVAEVEELLARPDKHSDPFLAFRLLRRLVEEVKALRLVVRNGSPVGKLTEASVSEIKAALRSGASGSYLAGKYGVTESAISFIKTGRTWRHIA